MSTNGEQQTNTTVCEKHGCELSTMHFGTYPYKYCQKCSDEAEEETKKQEAIQAEIRRKEALVSGIPQLYRNSDLSAIEGVEKIKAWLDTGSGFMFVHGGCGCGKTHLACAIKKEYNRRRIKCELVFSSDVFLRLRKSFSSKDDSEFDIIEKLAPDPEAYADDRIDMRTGFKIAKKTDNSLMIFDDVGAQKISEYVTEAWYNIINRRYMYNLKTLFTSNLSLKEISLSMSDRIASRLASGEVFKLQGNDRRLNRSMAG